jgi:hypothetical protein
MDGKERVLRFDLNAIAEIGERLDIKVRLGHLREDLLEVPLPMSAPRVFLWAGLLHDEESNLDEKEVGKLVDMENLPEVLTDFFSHFVATSAGAMAKATLAAEQDSQSNSSGEGETTNQSA